MALDDSLVRTRRWTRAEYDRLIGYGVFAEDEHLELLDGLLVVREPQGSRHSAAVVALQQALAQAFGSGFHVRPQLPIARQEPKGHWQRRRFRQSAQRECISQEESPPRGDGFR